MSGNIVAFPHRYSSSEDAPGAGPTGVLLDQIQAEEEYLNDLLDEFPFGSEFDAKAGVSKVTLIELFSAVHLLSLANRLIERASDREAKYDIDNGWPAPY